jgi:hypothetical protein
MFECWVVGSAHPTADCFTEWLYANTATVPKHTAQCAKTADCRPTILPIHKYPNPTPHLQITPAILNQVAEIALWLYLLRFMVVPLRWRFKDFSTVKCCYFFGMMTIGDTPKNDEKWVELWRSPMGIGHDV